MRKFKWKRIYTFLVLIMFTTMTFASFNTNLFINGKGYVRADGDVRITDIKLISSENEAYETYEPEYTKDTITVNANLPKQASTLTYQITVKNSSSYEYDLQKIIEETYSNKNIKYTITGITVDDTVLQPNSTTTFQLKLTNNVTITEEGDVYETKTYTFDYTGKEQEFIVPYDGEYTLEVWGASGGGTDSNYAGYGGYSVGKMKLKKNKILYIFVGGEGTSNIISPSSSYSYVTPGWNGGGSGYVSKEFYNYHVGSGGGSTDIRTTKGKVTFKNNSYYVDDKQSLESRIIVAGGGGGQGHDSSNPSKGSHAGGIQGNTVTSSWDDSHTHPIGGNQTSGTFGYGATPITTSTSTHLDTGNKSQFCSGGAGGGWYGGQASIYQNCRNFGGAGGSGYIGTEGLYDKAMYCFNCTESSVESTKTISVSQVSTEPEENKAKIGNGYAKITLIRKIEDGSDFDFDYTGGEQTFTTPYSGIYKLETWGAQGGTMKERTTEKREGGYGGYSKGIIQLNKNKTLYINVGGKGKGGFAEIEGGYNGGGSSLGALETEPVASGGGATHIASTSGLLQDVLPENLYIVSGGGGGSFTFAPHITQGGSGGGYIGVGGITNNSKYPSTGGGTQTEGGLKSGQGFNGAYGVGGRSISWAGAGGGGFYGGGGGYGVAGGGGSGYISNSELKGKIMYCYDCEESSEKDTKTVTTKSHSKLPKVNNAKEGNGYSKITLVKRLSNNIQMKLKFDIQKLTEYKINYNLDGGTVDSAPTTYKRNTNTFTIPYPTKSGYAFTGWTVGKNLYNLQYIRTVSHELSDASREDAGFARYVMSVKPNTYYTFSTNLPKKSDNGSYLLIKSDNNHDTYIFSGNDGISNNAPRTVKSTPEGHIVIAYSYDGINMVLNNPTEYWIQLEEGNKKTSYEAYISTPNKNISIEKGSRGNRTYTANWEALNYNINYELDGGTLSNPITTYNINSSNITLPTPTKEGYAFAGWTGGKNLLEVKCISTTLKGITFTVNSNGSITMDGTATGIIIYVINGDNTAPSSSVYLKDYEDIYIKPNSRYYLNGKPLSVGNSGYLVEILYDTNGVPGYPKGRFITRENLSKGVVYIKVNSGTVINNETVYPFLIEIKQEEHFEALYKTDPSGEYFNGYEKYISTPTKEITIPTGSIGNRTYIAKWNKIYTTTYNGNGGTSFSNRVEDGKTSTYYPTSTNGDKMFMGWYTEPEGGTLVSPVNFDYYKDRTLYAHWVDDKPIAEGNAITTSQDYTSYTYNSESKEYIIHQNVPAGLENWRGCLNFNYFGPVPWKYRYYVGFEIYVYDEDYNLFHDFNNRCDDCTTNDNRSNEYIYTNDKVGSYYLKKNTWNKVFMTYDNDNTTRNVNSNPVSDYTGIKLQTNENVTYKIRNIHYSYAPID